MVETIMKRDGRTVEFKQEKIAEAVERAFQACGAMQDRAAAEDIAQRVVDKLESGAIEGAPTVEGVQDLVEETLIESGFVQTAKSYILYRAERSRSRDVNSRLIQTLKDITFSKASDSDMKRENANIDADTAMGTMLKYGSESAKQFYEMCVIDPKFARAHREGDIHIHDMDFYTLTTTCCQIELKKLFKSGFSTGHGVLREPNDIASYAALACIAIQSNQNDQHGGQAICDFDYGLAEGVRKTYRRLYICCWAIPWTTPARSRRTRSRASRRRRACGPASPWTRASRPPCARRSWRSAPARRPPTRPWPMRLRTPWAIPTARRSRPWRRSCTT